MELQFLNKSCRNAPGLSALSLECVWQGGEAALKNSTLEEEMALSNSFSISWSLFKALHSPGSTGAAALISVICQKPQTFGFHPGRAEMKPLPTFTSDSSALSYLGGERLNWCCQTLPPHPSLQPGCPSTSNLSSLCRLNTFVCLLKCSWQDAGSWFISH